MFISFLTKFNQIKIEFDDVWTFLSDRGRWLSVTKNGKEDRLIVDYF